MSIGCEKYYKGGQAPTFSRGQHQFYSKFGTNIKFALKVDINFKSAKESFLIRGIEKFDEKIASAGNRTRAARVAGEHSTTEPTMLMRRVASGRTR